MPEFFDWLGNLNVVKLAILAGAIASVGWAGFSAWRRIRQSEHRTRLTAMMLERGMTAEQIEKVIQAGFIGRDVESDADKSTPADGDPEVRIIAHLAECHYEAEDSQKIVAAARRNGRIDEATVRIIETLASNWEDTDAIVKLLEARRDRLGANGEVVDTRSTTETLAGAGRGV
jgi:hypothetical protein